MKKDRHVHVVREKKWNMAVRSAKTEVVENGKKVSAVTVKKDSVKMLTAKKHSADAKQATEKNLLVNAVKNSNIRKIRSHALRVLLQTTDARKRLLAHASETDKPILGMHLPWPGVVRVMRDGTGFAAATWEGP